MECEEDVYSKLEICLNDQHKQDLSVVRKVSEARTDFLCHNDGHKLVCKYGCCCAGSALKPVIFPKLVGVFKVKHAD